MEMEENLFSFVIKYRWMSKLLGLKDNDLEVYAIIYGFSHDGQSKFSGSLQYLADWCGCTKQGIQKNLKNLIDKGLIIKTESFKNGVKFPEYSVDMSQLYTMQLSCIPPMQLSCTNNIDIYNIDNIKEIKEKLLHDDMVLLTANRKNIDLDILSTLITEYLEWASTAGRKISGYTQLRNNVNYWLQKPLANDRLRALKEEKIKRSNVDEYQL